MATEDGTRDSSQAEKVGELMDSAADAEETQMELSLRTGAAVVDEVEHLKVDNYDRGTWSAWFEFFLSSLGYAVGFGNLWRFPFLAYKHGGGAFLIPYAIFFCLIGLPIFLLELSLGQFTSCGTLTCWRYAPLFKGIGIGSMVIAWYYTTYYNVLLAWSFWYFFASFTSELPWASCGDWSTEFCLDRVVGCNSSDPNQIRFANNGSCYLKNNNSYSNYSNINNYNNNSYNNYNNINNYSNNSSGSSSSNFSGELGMTFAGIFNSTAAAAAGVRVKIPAQEFLEYISLRDKLADFEHLGPLRWDMTLCLLLSWVVVFLCLIKGVKSSGKVVYFTALFPYLILIVLFVNMLGLEGTATGVRYFIVPNVTKLASPEPWKDAAVQIFFTLSAAEGGLITMASYNRFDNNVVRDSLLIPLCNCLTSLFAGFTVFGYIGYLASVSGEPLDTLAESGTALAFVVYPQALTSLPAPIFWSLIFFLMLVALGLDSQFVLVESVVTSLCDQWPNRLRRHKSLVILAFCFFAFVSGLPMTTNGGTYILTLMDTYAGGFNVILLAILECVSIGYVYGARRFAADIEAMTGSTVFGCVPWRFAKWWWIAGWTFITPVCLLGIFVFSFVDYPTLSHAGYSYPLWAEAFGWLMTTSVVLATVTTGIVKWAMQLAKGQGPYEALATLCKPERKWGPALPSNRAKVARARQKASNPALRDDYDPAAGEEFLSNI